MDIDTNNGCLDLERSCPCRVGGWRCADYEQMCRCAEEMFVDEREASDA